ncbi:helix-turn-helix transcriptional regulator [Sinomonas terrae]|uniref:Helix-turn-helix transcriptional regulator n=1 Tax=Sinomonas terrae TaxID=2908838 RepID=A0ABS9TX10_9MICC|nr:helix-turn-helix transcriptional regulator [Sinomonas terrae]MCH6468911.1 helix-turn-helix transcriptional regulator [Sinomonas terrae]
MEPRAQLAADLLGLPDHDEYLRAASELLFKLFPGENVAWNMLDAEAPSAEVRAYPGSPLADADVARILLELWEDHPLVLSYLEARGEEIWSPRRLSDLVTDEQLYRTRAYREGLAQLGTNRQLSFLARRTSPLRIQGWTMNRLGMDFTDDEVELARHLQPVLRLLEAARSDGRLGQRWEGVAEEHDVTSREQEILRLLSKGLTGMAIGHLLGISPRTVAKHLEHAYSKLGCTNRIDALRLLRGD